MQVPFNCVEEIFYVVHHVCGGVLKFAKEVSIDGLYWVQAPFCW
jgi:hypothetical protein